MVMAIATITAARNKVPSQQNLIQTNTEKHMEEKHMELDRCATQMETHIKESGKKTHILVRAPCSMQMEIVMKGVGKTAWQTVKGFTLIQAGADTMANGIAARGMAKWPFSLRWWPIQPTGVNESCAVGPEA